jgi:hypothetical protein
VEKDPGGTGEGVWDPVGQYTAALPHGPTVSLVEARGHTNPARHGPVQLDVPRPGLAPYTPAIITQERGKRRGWWVCGRGVSTGEGGR